VTLLAEYQWIADDAALQVLVDRVPPQTLLYLDTEFMRERTFWPRLALVQVNAGQGCYLIDPLAVSSDALSPLLAGRSLVMHACSEDLEALRVGAGVAPTEVIDTQVGAALCGHDLQCSYQKLVELLLGVSLPKSATRTDWLQRPLSAEQLEYAAHDVEYLPGIHQIIHQRLSDMGRLGWWQEECARLVSDCQSTTPPEQLWRQVKGASSLDGPGRRRLRQLAVWRDDAARRKDIPRSFVLKDGELLALASQGASNKAALAAFGMHPSALRRFADELLTVLASADQGDIPDPLPGMPEPAVRDRIKRLRDHLGKLAAAHELAPEVLARRRWIESYARDPEVLPEAFSGWRASIIGNTLGELV
jgi:ribonuclease D